MFGAYQPFGNYTDVTEVTEARVAAGEARRASQSVEQRLDRALLACQAMWSLVSDALKLTDEQLLQRMESGVSVGQFPKPENGGGTALSRWTPESADVWERNRCGSARRR